MTYSSIRWATCRSANSRLASPSTTTIESNSPAESHTNVLCASGHSNVQSAPKPPTTTAVLSSASSNCCNASGSGRSKRTASSISRPTNLAKCSSDGITDVGAAHLKPAVGADLHRNRTQPQWRPVVPAVRALGSLGTASGCANSARLRPSRSPGSQPTTQSHSATPKSTSADPTTSAPTPHCRSTRKCDEPPHSTAQRPRRSPAHDSVMQRLQHPPQPHSDPARDAPRSDRGSRSSAATTAHIRCARNPTFG